MNNMAVNTMTHFLLLENKQKANACFPHRQKTADTNRAQRLVCSFYVREWLSLSKMFLLLLMLMISASIPYGKLTFHSNHDFLFLILIPGVSLIFAAGLTAYSGFGIVKSYREGRKCGVLFIPVLKSRHKQFEPEYPAFQDVVNAFGINCEKYIELLAKSPASAFWLVEKDGMAVGEHVFQLALKNRQTQDSPDCVNHADELKNVLAHYREQNHLPDLAKLLFGDKQSLGESKLKQACCELEAKIAWYAGQIKTPDKEILCVMPEKPENDDYVSWNQYKADLMRVLTTYRQIQSKSVLTSNTVSG